MDRLVIVDDDKIMLNYIKEMYEDEFEVVIFTKPLEFLSYLENNEFDKVTHLVMDLNLHDEIDGIELLERTKKLYPKDDKPILVLFSGNADALSSTQKEKLSIVNAKIVSKINLDELGDYLLGVDCA